MEEPSDTVNITDLCCRLLEAMVSHQCKGVYAAA